MRQCSARLSRGMGSCVAAAATAGAAAMSLRQNFPGELCVHQADLFDHHSPLLSVVCGLR